MVHSALLLLELPFYLLQFDVFLLPLGQQLLDVALLFFPRLVELTDLGLHLGPVLHRRRELLLLGPALCDQYLQLPPFFFHRGCRAASLRQSFLREILLALGPPPLQLLLGSNCCGLDAHLFLPVGFGQGGFLLIGFVHRSAGSLQLAVQRFNLVAGCLLQFLLFAALRLNRLLQIPLFRSSFLQSLKPRHLSRFFLCDPLPQDRLLLGLQTGYFLRQLLLLLLQGHLALLSQLNLQLSGLRISVLLQLVVEACDVAVLFFQLRSKGFFLLPGLTG